MQMKPNDKLTAIDQAFPASVKALMPPYGDIPDEFKNSPRNKWVRVFSDLFYSGATNLQWIAKDGIDQKAAVRHLRTVMGSYEPKHEHKEAACAYLMSLWFDDITYTRKDADERSD